MKEGESSPSSIEFPLALLSTVSMKKNVVMLPCRYSANRRRPPSRASPKLYLTCI